jgi:hypothetical protein
MRTHPALREHFAWHDKMKKLLANPIMDALSAQWKREKEQMARAVALLQLKDPTR